MTQSQEGAYDAAKTACQAKTFKSLPHAHKAINLKLQSGKLDMKVAHLI